MPGGRDNIGAVRLLPLWIGLSIVAVIGAAAGWRVTRFARAPLHTHTLPGFAIDLPDGKVEVDDRRYGNGQLNLGKLAGVGSFMRLAWEPHFLAHISRTIATWSLIS